MKRLFAVCLSFLLLIGPMNLMWRWPKKIVGHGCSNTIKIQLVLTSNLLFIYWIWRYNNAIQFITKLLYSMFVKKMLFRGLRVICYRNSLWIFSQLFQTHFSDWKLFLVGKTEYRNLTMYRFPFCYSRGLLSQFLLLTNNGQTMAIIIDSLYIFSFVCTLQWRK